MITLRKLILRPSDPGDARWRGLKVRCVVGLDVPDWIEPDVTLGTVVAITEEGCASGAYMPACLHDRARETMAEHGEEVLDYLAERLYLSGERLTLGEGGSWSELERLNFLPDPQKLAGKVLSAAVECWAAEVMDLLEEVTT
jgi:hypothetical protein